MYIARDTTPCMANDPELWFAKPGTKKSQRAKAYCQQLCEERHECLAATLRYEERKGATSPGVYGGLNERERARLAGRSPRPWGAAVTA